jgi:CheY-like chemotaxis protein
VVEDGEALRIAIYTMLRKEGFTVWEATDGQAALELLRKHTGDLNALFLDVTPPGSRVLTSFARPGACGPICA